MVFSFVLSFFVPSSFFDGDFAFVVAAAVASILSRIFPFLSIQSQLYMLPPLLGSMCRILSCSFFIFFVLLLTGISYTIRKRYSCGNSYIHFLVHVSNIFVVLCAPRSMLVNEK